MTDQDRFDHANEQAFPTEAPDLSAWLPCECTNCTHRWFEDPEGVGTIRCPIEDCRSKNVEVGDA